MTRIFVRLLLILLALAAFSTTAQEAATPADGIIIDFPPSVYHVSGTVDVYGTVNPPGLRSYFLEVVEYDPAGGETAWLPVSLPASTPVISTVIARWDTALLPDGLYRLRVRVVLTNNETLVYAVGPIRVLNSGEGASPTVPSAPNVQAAPPTPAPLPVNDLPIPVGGHVLSLDEAAVTAMRSAGLTWIKWQIRLRLTEREAFLDGALRKLQQANDAGGFYVLLGVVGYKDEMQALGLDAYYAQFAEVMGQLAALNPQAIEVWNKPNIDREWPTGRIDPTEYAEMLRLSYNAIKATNPNVMVIAGALAPTGAESVFGLGSVWNDDRYYQGMANAGVAQFADCIGVHYNEGVLPPALIGGDPRGTYPTYYLPSMLDRVAAPFATSGIPLCFTELGYLSPDGYGPLPGSFAWGSNTSVDEQAAWLRDAVQVLAGYQRLPVDLMIIWNIDFEQYEDDPQAGFAILRPDGACPACAAIATLRGQ